MIYKTIATCTFACLVLAWSGEANGNGIPAECENARGDWNGDYIVDIDDFSAVANCLLGPNVDVGEGCETADLDGDGDVDFHDAGLFQAAFGTGCVEIEGTIFRGDGVTPATSRPITVYALSTSRMVAPTSSVDPLTGEYVLVVAVGFTGRVVPRADDVAFDTAFTDYVDINASAFEQNFTAAFEFFVDDDDPAAGPRDGTEARPFATIQEAAELVLAGDTVTIKDGFYTPPNTNQFTPVLKIVRSGIAGRPIRFQNFPGDSPVLDSEAVLSRNAEGNRWGIWIPAGFEFIEISGLTVQHAFRDGILVESSSNITLEDSIFRENGLLQCGSESTNVKFEGASNCTVRRVLAENGYAGFVFKDTTDCLIEDSMAMNNGTTANGTIIYPENADGIAGSAATQGSTRLIVRHCLAAGNLDDQFDLTRNMDSIVERCAAFDGRGGDCLVPCGGGDEECGDGNGFKVGNDATRLTLRFCVAFNNDIDGIDPRAHTEPLFYNNVAYGNGVLGFSTGASGSNGTFFNNISFNPRASNGDLFTGGNPIFSDYNLWADGRFVPNQDDNFLSGDPLFVNPDGVIDTTYQGTVKDTVDFIFDQVWANFALQADSPCIDSGLDPADRGQPGDFMPVDSAPANTGGGTLGFYDMGAIEFGVTPQRIGVGSVSGIRAN